MNSQNTIKHLFLRELVVFILSITCTICFINNDSDIIIKAAHKTEKKKGADSAYKLLCFSEKKTIKSGKYYLKYSAGKVTISTKKNGSYRATPLPYEICSNGKQAYYIKGNHGDKKTLCKYVFSSGKEKKLRKLPNKNDEDYDNRWGFSIVKGNKLYVHTGSDVLWCEHTYVYDIKKNTFSKIKGNCVIEMTRGKFALCRMEHRSDVSPYPITLMKFADSGMKKIKTITLNGTLANRGNGTAFIGSKIYYIDYADSYMKKASLCCCNTNGNGKKKIATFEATDKYGGIEIYDITTKECKVQISGDGVYRYHYASGKKKKIK